MVGRYVATAVLGLSLMASSGKALASDISKDDVRTGGEIGIAVDMPKFDYNNINEVTGSANELLNLVYDNCQPFPVMEARREYIPKLSYCHNFGRSSFCTGYVSGNYSTSSNTTCSEDLISIDIVVPFARQANDISLVNSTTAFNLQTDIDFSQIDLEYKYALKQYDDGSRVDLSLGLINTDVSSHSTLNVDTQIQTPVVSVGGSVIDGQYADFNDDSWGYKFGIGASKPVGDAIIFGSIEKAVLEIEGQTRGTLPSLPYVDVSQTGLSYRIGVSFPLGDIVRNSPPVVERTATVSEKVNGEEGTITVGDKTISLSDYTDDDGTIRLDLLQKDYPKGGSFDLSHGDAIRFPTDEDLREVYLTRANAHRFNLGDCEEELEFSLDRAYWSGDEANDEVVLQQPVTSEPGHELEAPVPEPGRLSRLPTVDDSSLKPVIIVDGSSAMISYDDFPGNVGSQGANVDILDEIIPDKKKCDDKFKGRWLAQYGYRFDDPLSELEKLCDK